MFQKRVSGRRLATHLGEQVILLGTITRKSASGKSIELLTTDGAQVNVTLNEALNENAEGYIEVHGTVQSKGTVSCTYYICFPSTMTTKFNANQYNDYLAMINVLGAEELLLFKEDTEV